jgi:hypothetical protein
MRSRAVLLVLVLTTILLSPLPASAGGNWIEIRDDDTLNAYLVPGSGRVASAQAYAEDPRKVREQGPYFAWLSHGLTAGSPRAWIGPGRFASVASTSIGIA